jgi:hypothetical protein
MAGQQRRLARVLRPVLGPVLRPVLGLVAALLLGLGAAPHPAIATSTWDGSLDLYRTGTFTTQKTWLWCTAADVQIISNIVDGGRDHSRSSQQRYFDWMRAHNRYDLPLSAGVDPAGWSAGLRHFVDDRYRLVASGSFDAALRSAVQRMRATNLPVALAVEHGNHGWVLTGFSATADPATTKVFTVTSVRVVGPLWGLQSRTYGYDMRPGRSLTTRQLRGFFTPWWYAPTRMIWDGSYVSIQPVPQPKPQAASEPLVDRPSWSTGSGAVAGIAPSPPPGAVASLAPGAAASPAPAASPAGMAAASPSVVAPLSADDGAVDQGRSDPVADLLSTPFAAIVAIALVGAIVVVGAGLLTRRRSRHSMR